jgi:hypothetical protein
MLWIIKNSFEAFKLHNLNLPTYEKSLLKILKKFDETKEEKTEIKLNTINQPLFGREKNTKNLIYNQQLNSHHYL